ncbi:hypothetical protein [Mannheimia massilioguelmaensis]|uniref:hypothetical protein n=1 Tax=Mannheimia massilioguelmaensis TaxID=1604354 RepID=UPI000B1D5BE0
MFKQAPIPFIGQKRMFLQHFERLLNDNIPNDGDGWTIVDAFLFVYTSGELRSATLF